MNRHQIEGTWEQLVGQLKTSLGKLIDNELLQLEGRRDQAVGAARKSYGAAAADADRGATVADAYAERAADSTDSTAASLGRSARDRAQDAIDTVSSQAGYLSDRAERGMEEIGRAARNAPINTKALAVGILLIVVGLLSSR